MANTKEYKIVINGVQQSIDAVKALEKELFNLEERIKALEAKSINIKGGSSTGGGGSSRTSNASSLSEEEKLEKQILQTEAKRKAYSKEIYQNYLAAKEQLKETENDQKQLAAAERLQARNYTNTMRGLKSELADLKEVIQTTDLASESYKKMSDRILEVTNKLKELEQAQGTFSRDVGHYEKAAQGFNKIKVAVGDTVREYDNYRKAIKELKAERFELSQTVGTESKEYKNVDIAVKKLESDYKDLDKSSAFMDNLLDTMQGFTALANIGVGIQSLFNIDDKSYNESMQKMASLLMVLKGIESLQLTLQKKEGYLAKFFNTISESLNSVFSEKNGNLAGSNLGMGLAWFLDKTINLFDKLKYKTISETKALKEMLEVFDDPRKASHFANVLWPNYSKEEKEAQYIAAMNWKIAKKYEKGWENLFNGFVTFTVRGFKILSKALLGIFTGGVLLFLPEIISGFSNLVKSLNTTKNSADLAAEAMNAFNRQLEIRKDLLAGDYLRKAISDEQFLNKTYEMESESIAKQIDLIRARAEALQKTGVWGLYEATQNIEFTGKKLDMPATVGAGKLSYGGLFDNDLEITIKDTNELEKAWSRCAAAIKKGKDYLDMWGDRSSWWETLKTEWGSLTVTVKDTQEAMRGLGNIRLGDFISDFQEVNQKFNEGGMTAEEYAKKISELKNEMNDNKVLNSVIANLDKYIPDEGVRTAVQNIINELIRLDNAFNMTSAEQVHHWNQVRIDGMKEGSAKIKAQIDENERYEIQQYGHTQEQINLIRAKYTRQRENQLKAYYKSQSSLTKEHQKKLNDAEDELMKLRIENMENGYAKQLALLKKEESDRLKKAKEAGIKVEEIQVEIKKLYHRKQLELDRQWAYDTAKVYEDLYSTIVAIQRNAMNTEVGTATQNVGRKKGEDINNIGYFYANYDNTVRNAKSMYDEILRTEIAASKKQATIREEQLFKEKQFTDREENLRHERMADEEAVSLVMEELAKHQGEISEEEWQKIHDNLKDALFKMNGEIVSKFNERTIDIKKFFELIEKEQDAHTANMNAIQRKYESDLKQSEADATKEQRDAVNKRYTNIINAISRNEEKISRIRQKAIVRDTQGWGIVDIKKTNENYKQIITGYNNTISELVKLKKQLKQQLDNKEITPEDYLGQVNNIDEKIRNLKANLKDAETAAKNTIGEFIASINQYAQALGSGLQQIMSSLWHAQDAQFDKEQDAIDKQNDALDKALDKQQEIVERHKDKIDSIEDELSTARGDRRQHLIDQLNAEMTAQREAQAQEKKIQKEKEALERKQEALDKKRKEAQYKRDLASILVSGAMAAVNAYATKPFIPVGLAMGTMAIALTAAQYGIAKANKPYAKGGLLEGPSHAQGGIPVGNTGIEVEGKEYVIRKSSTAPNIEILDYINKSQRKLDLDDFIEFYSSGKVRKTITSMSPRSRFAEGGTIPTLNTNIDINDRLLSAFEDYSNRPVYVSVQDINSRQKAVKDVQVLAGLTE